MQALLVPLSAFLFVIVVHEFSHGYVAYLMGDDTAKDSGRLTLNPIPHIDPVGTVILPLLLAISHSPVIFGWARPVPIDPRNFKDPRKGLFLSSLAGPLSNFAVAVILALIFRMGLFGRGTIVWTFLVYGVMISLVLGIFNLIPIPPLDGSNMVSAILPPVLARRYMSISRYGFVILIALLYFGILDKVVLPLVRMTAEILLG